MSLSTEDPIIVRSRQPATRASEARNAGAVWDLQAKRSGATANVKDWRRTRSTTSSAA
jgi:hypothetical protein